VQAQGAVFLRKPVRSAALQALLSAELDVLAPGGQARGETGT
jgi:hypothetical protein